MAAKRFSHEMNTLSSMLYARFSALSLYLCFLEKIIKKILFFVNPFLSTHYSRATGCCFILNTRQSFVSVDIAIISETYWKGSRCH